MIAKASQKVSQDLRDLHPTAISPYARANRSARLTSVGMRNGPCIWRMLSPAAAAHQSWSILRRTAIAAHLDDLGIEARDDLHEVLLLAHHVFDVLIDAGNLVGAGR